MLWAIDVGNTHTVVGLWDGQCWTAVWRRSTNPSETEDELAASLGGLCALTGIPFEARSVVCASVVPDANVVWERFSARWLRCEVKFLRSGRDVGLSVLYEPPNAVGADRIANALAALALTEPPVIIVDFGTATTFDVVDSDGAYAGGAIMPGVEVSTEALVGRTAKLPRIELVAPKQALGRNTTESLQSGIVLGYAGGIEAVAKRLAQEVEGKPTILATGGLGALFLDLCPSIEWHEPNLTLDGLRLAMPHLLANP